MFCQRNIFISGAGTPRIGGFGLSEISSSPEPGPALAATTHDQQGEHDSSETEEEYTAWRLAGDPWWQAPELLMANSLEEYRRTMSSDIFAFGRVILEVQCFGCRVRALLTLLLDFYKNNAFLRQTLFSNSY